MTSTTITVEVSRRGVATVTLNRPEKGNPFNGEMLEAMAGQFAAFAAEPAVRVVVLRGSGKHFCVGADMEPGSHLNKGGPGLIEVCTVLDTLPKPTVAVVHGACIGGGLALAGCCDVMLARDDAFFSIPEVRLGFAAVPLAPLLLRMIGARNLRRLAQTGERFFVEEALRIGLVHRSCDAPALDAALAAVIDNLLLGAPNALAEMKAICATLDVRQTTPEMSAELQSAFARMRDSAEGVEGRAAFREKRKSSWYPGE
ncbi:MAG: hypothetical protein JWP38_1744 [Herbaspirillum sp.]|nr:hypothetical protein [Herbaspirillum sp.]